MEQDDEFFVFFSAPGTMIVLRPWWRRMDDRDHEFLEYVRMIEGRWEDFLEWEETYDDLTGAAEIRGEIALGRAISIMLWAMVHEWMEEELAFWNWCVRRRNRRASGTGHLTLEMWEGRAYVVDPLTGWWIEEAVPDQRADAV
jgi:hypothetical protein